VQGDMVMVTESLDPATTEKLRQELFATATAGK
jgi:ABC-type phosphate/phosphonate transport system substrate-binding protein